MLIVDDILLSPVRGLFWIFRELANSARQETENEAKSISVELGELYMMLETGEITEEKFDAREKDLLDRLDEIQGGEKYAKMEDEV